MFFKKLVRPFASEPPFISLLQGHTSACVADGLLSRSTQASAVWTEFSPSPCVTHCQLLVVAHGASDETECRITESLRIGTLLNWISEQYIYMVPVEKQVRVC
jgi:hypothetical protein